MINSTSYLAPMAGIIGSIHLAAGLHFLRKLRISKMENSTHEKFVRLASSVFPEFNHDELSTHESEIDPLIEAEIYLVYGRARDAQDVLKKAVTDGRVTPEEATLFWSSNTDRQINRATYKAMNSSYALAPQA